MSLPFSPLALSPIPDSDNDDEASWDECLLAPEPTSPKTPQVASSKLSLKVPSALSSRDKSPWILLSDSGLKASYNGMGKSDADAAAVRSNLTIPSRLGVYYYEVLIVDKGRDGFIAIGFCKDKVALSRLPGWEPHSWGFHGDDGHSFCCSGTGKQYGPTFTTGDTIGCGINFLDGTAFYTKNGVFLGTAFKHLNPVNPLTPHPQFYATIGLRTPGEVVQTNFGAKPFLFDIEQYVRDEVLRARQGISKSSSPSTAEPSSPSSSKKSPSSPPLPQLFDLVLDYLVHQGHYSSAESLLLSNSKNPTDTTQDVDMDSPNPAAKIHTLLAPIIPRTEITTSIISGGFRQALDSLATNFPKIAARRDLIFWLRVGEFVESLRTINEDSGQIIQAAGTTPPPPPHASARKLKSKSTSATTQSSPITNVFQIGTQLRAEFQDEFGEDLVAVFSLLAYSAPETSPMGHLLQSPFREKLAGAVNSAVFSSAGGRDVSGLEQLVKQLRVVKHELAEAGDGRNVLLGGWRSEEYCRRKGPMDEDIV